MITEIARIEVRPGREKEFEEAVAQALPYFLAADDCDGVDLHRSPEHLSRYRLTVRWETVEHHTVAFRGSEGFAKWRGRARGRTGSALQPRGSSGRNVTCGAPVRG
ncbi:antibiotic biosynthesis monooxygenase family protein [Streptomyces sp. NPDC059787]|uniref:antibiotic biosynthesis monooxygenase family protein n=1 Tax=Streptomyces sp. NPDC059787 TaxID=3346947 RepID=UPI003660B913